ncbi:hypothetical protein [Roseobacter litoralis]|nr:hypothetical protein [Roseobacter litoralis]
MPVNINPAAFVDGIGCARGIILGCHVAGPGSASDNSYLSCPAVFHAYAA